MVIPAAIFRCVFFHSTLVAVSGALPAKLFKEAWLAFGCMNPLFCRMALVHVILL
jgi:hypothetical protein